MWMGATVKKLTVSWEKMSLVKTAATVINVSIPILKLPNGMVLIKSGLLRYL